MQKYFEINECGNNIRCKVYYRDRPAASNAVLYCTGFAGHKDNRATQGFAEKLLAKYKDVIVIVFNWPAHGDDVKKKVSLKDCDTYLELVIRDAKTRFGARRLYSYSTSFGGYLVLKYLSERGNPFEKLAIRCPVVDMYGIFLRSIMKNDDMEKIEKGRDVRVGFDRKITVSRSFLEELQENDIRKREFLDFAEDIIIIHGTADEIVPFEASREFADNNLIEFYPIENADHRFHNPTHMSLANKYVLEFFDIGNE